jgi:arylsulfatase
LSPQNGLKLRLILLSLFLVVPQESTNNEKVIRKILFISIDTLRADFLDCYNPKIKTSPNLSRFGHENILFAHATSQAPSTALSHKSVFYSLYPSIHKTSRSNVPDEMLTAPIQELRSNGFTTAGFVGGGELSGKFGFARGFDLYWEGASYSATDTKESLERLEHHVYKWLDSNWQKKFFLFVHTYEVHCPYFAPKEYRDRYAGWYGGEIDPKGKCGDNYYNRRKLSGTDRNFVRDLYAAEIAYVDEFIGRLFERFQSLGIYDETLIVVLSDHGESLGEGDYVGHNLLRNIQLQIPLMIRIPGIGSRRVDSPVESIDVMPTIFKVLNLRPPFQFQGRDLIPLITKNIPISKRNSFSEQSGRVRVRRGNMVAIFFPHGDPSYEVYDLQADPEERINLALRYPDFARSCRKDYLRMLRRSQDVASKFINRPPGPSPIDEQVKEQLRTLGYIP